MTISSGTPPSGGPPNAIEIREVSRSFGTTVALSKVSIVVRRGEIHALLGPNGAGKTTLLRVLAGLTIPSEGSASVMGNDVIRQSAAARRTVGWIPSGDRTFYERISGLENLIFFGRLYGFGYRDAARRARDALAAVGLTSQTGIAVGRYSHGMRKRLAIARGLLADQGFLLVDEGTHDLDPEGARRVRELVRAAADRGAGVLWATQRVDEIRGFADTVTLLHQGGVRFTGTPAQLVSLISPRRFLIRVRNGTFTPERLSSTLSSAVGSLGAVVPDQSGDGEHYVLTVGESATLGEAIAAIIAADLQVLSCHETQSQIEQAFISLTAGPPA